MYKIVLNHVKHLNEFEELVKLFLKPSEYIMMGDSALEHSKDQPVETENNMKDATIVEVPSPLALDCTSSKGKNTVKRFLYDYFNKATGLRPEWGILTGIRPVKLAGELICSEGSEKKAKEKLYSDYEVSEEKTELLFFINDIQRKCLPKDTEGAKGLYIGIPFCPTRCLYCSFTSNQAKEAQIAAYLRALYEEITFSAEQMNKMEWYAESIYVGGGTPTTLSASQLNGLLSHICSSFNLEKTVEFTVEAGRPDTITVEKLRVLKAWNITRISINPQSMKAKTLELIGRAHAPEAIISAFEMARKEGFSIINADIIAGLPEESPADFINTVKAVLEIAPENITVHTMALKRASKLKAIDSDYHYKQGQAVREMLEMSRGLLSEAGYLPYYLYRQKHMAGNFENIGYAKAGTEGIYNIRIMEEKQTIIALGAGGISKRYYAGENRLERVPNVSNYEIYIERIDEMLQRKAENLFCAEPVL